MTRHLLPAEPNPAGITAVIDNREQLPFELSPLQMEPGTLAAGDYSVKGLEAFVALERKSLSDLVSCCGNERHRFERELQRLLGYPARAVVVEASWADLERGEWRSAISPQSVFSSVTGWIALGVPFVLAGDRELAQRFATKFLYIAARRRWREARALIASVETGAAP